MNLKDFKDHIQSFKQGTQFKRGIGGPFSWRGSYDEVAFSIVGRPMFREEILENIQAAYNRTFEGYKGGEYRFYDDTPVNFEECEGDWSDGGYCSKWISEIEQTPPYSSQEERLIKLLF